MWWHTEDVKRKSALPCPSCQLWQLQGPQLPMTSGLQSQPWLKFCIQLGLTVQINCRVEKRTWFYTTTFSTKTQPFLMKSSSPHTEQEWYTTLAFDFVPMMLVSWIWLSAISLTLQNWSSMKSFVNPPWRAACIDNQCCPCETYLSCLCCKIGWMP